jgi:hypothetical protein
MMFADEEGEAVVPASGRIHFYYFWRKKIVNIFNNASLQT